MLYSPKETLIFPSERFWMKKTFSLGEGVFLIRRAEKNDLFAKRNKNLNLKIR